MSWRGIGRLLVVLCMITRWTHHSPTFRSLAREQTNNFNGSVVGEHKQEGITRVKRQCGMMDVDATQFRDFNDRVGCHVGAWLDGECGSPQARTPSPTKSKRRRKTPPTGGGGGGSKSGEKKPRHGLSSSLSFSRSFSSSSSSSSSTSSTSSTSSSSKKKIEQALA